MKVSNCRSLGAVVIVEGTALGEVNYLKTSFENKIINIECNNLYFSIL